MDQDRTTATYPPTSKGQPILAGLLLVFSTFILCTLVRIELLNSKVGNELPRKPRYAGAAGPSKWRGLHCATEETWRKMLGPKGANGLPVSRQLTDEETAKMKRDVANAINRNQLRAVVSTWGLIQYPLVLVTLLLSVWIMASQGGVFVRIVGCGGIALALVAGGVMIQRGYFTSLGY